MSDQIKLIAQRIKELREIEGISIEDLARELHISKELYEQYESGTVDIPVSFLYHVASRFNVELTAILTGEGPKLHIYSLVRKEKGVSVERRKDYKYYSLAYNFINKKAEPFMVIVDPQNENTATVSFNTHAGHEFNYVIEGTLKVIIDKYEVILNEGDSLYFDSSYKHAMQALNGKPAKFLVIITM